MAQYQIKIHFLKLSGMIQKGHHLPVMKWKNMPLMKWIMLLKLEQIIGKVIVQIF